MATELSGTVVTSTGPYNGAAVDAWLVSRFGGVQPVYNAAPPTGSPDGGPVTSGTAFGGAGAWTISGVVDGAYYVRAQIGSNSNWVGPVESTADADLLHKAGAETKTGLLTLSAGLTVSGGVLTVPAGSIGVAALTGVLPIANGGTGASTQPFVDLTTAQTKGGALTLSSTPVLNAGLNVTAGPVTFPNGSIAQAAVAGAGTPNAGVDIGSTQTVTGQKTFTNDLPILGGQVLGTALATPAAPVVTPQGTAGTTTYQYEIVATAQDGRDTIPSPVGQTTTGNATLTTSNYNALSWSAVTGAASYKVLRNISGTYQLLVAGLTSPSYNDQGIATPSAYSAVGRNPGGEVNALGARNLGLIPVGGPAAGFGPCLVQDYGFDLIGRLWVCTVAGSPGTWRSVGGVGAYKGSMYVATGGQGVPTSGFNIVAYDTITNDPNGNLTTGVGAHYTAPVAGEYLVSAGVMMASSTSGNYLTAFFVGATERRRTAWNGPLLACLGAGSVRLTLAAGDAVYYEMQATSAGNTVTAGASLSYFDICLLGS